MTSTPTPSPSTSDQESTSLQLETTVRARQLWKEQGCPEGCDVDLWLRAEQQILAGWKQPAKVESDGAVPASPLHDALNPLTHRESMPDEEDPADIRAENAGVIGGQTPL